MRREIGEEVGEISGFRRRREGSLHLVVVDREGGDLPVRVLEVPRSRVNVIGTGVESSSGSAGSLLTGVRVVGVP